MNVLKGLLCFLAFFIIVSGIGFMTQGTDFMLYKFFAPKQEAVRTQVYRESQAQQDGVINELQKLQLEYVSTNNPDARAIIVDSVIHKSAQFTGQLTPSLNSFVSECKRSRGIN